MDLFKAAQRIPPRRLPVVHRYDALPVGPSVPILLPTKRPPIPATVVGGFAGMLLVMGLLYQFSEPEQANVVNQIGRAHV